MINFITQFLSFNFSRVVVTEFYDHYLELFMGTITLPPLLSHSHVLSKLLQGKHPHTYLVLCNALNSIFKKMRGTIVHLGRNLCKAV